MKVNLKCPLHECVHHLFFKLCQALLQHLHKANTIRLNCTTTLLEIFDTSVQAHIACDYFVTLDEFTIPFKYSPPT